MTWRHEFTDVYHYTPDPDGHGVTLEFCSPSGKKIGHMSATQIAVINDELARRRHESGEE